MISNPQAFMNFDVIIVGGGMVGAATACALKHTFSKIALIDASPLDMGEDHRLIALNHSSISFLKNLTLWQHLQSTAGAIQEIHISHKGHFGVCRLSAKDVKLPFLGYVVPAKHINEMLYKQCEHITLLRPATLNSLQQTPDHVTVQIGLPQGTKELTTKILIAADGTHSTVRELADIPVKKENYHQSALVTTTDLNRSHFYTAYERFQEQGAIAMLPLVGNKVATIWTESTEVIQNLLQLNDADFLKQLQHQFGYRLGKLKTTSKRFTYPLQMIKAKHKVKERIILLGNAAHTLHPIAAQGFNLALFEIATLCEFFSKNGTNLNLLNDFANFQENFSIQLSHQLTSLFAYDFFPLNKLREFGLIALDLCLPLKKYFLQKVLGGSQAMPLLLREQASHEHHSL